MEIPLSQESINMSVEHIRCQTKVLDQDWPGPVSAASSGFDYVWPPNLEGHNFFVRTPFQVFLDSMESSLSLESNHILFNDIQ